VVWEAVGAVFLTVSMTLSASPYDIVSKFCKRL
jgi:hypothetical protein